MRRLKAIGQAAAVVFAMFVKVFPLSGIFLAMFLVVVFACFGDPNRFKQWFGKPMSWWHCVTMTILVSLVSMLISYFLISLFRASPLGGPDFSRFSPVRGNPRLLATWLLVIWSVVALGEEIIGRGFLIDRLLVAFERAFYAAFLAVVVSALIFGSIHFYQGVAGVVDNTCTGLIFGVLYLTRGEICGPTFFLMV